MVEISNGKSCGACNKSSVCRYKEGVMDETEQLIETVKRIDLPLSININCKEYDNKISSAPR